MGCIEMRHSCIVGNTGCGINRNMGCIEIPKNFKNIVEIPKINRNMGCIEMILCDLLYSVQYGLIETWDVLKSINNGFNILSQEINRNMGCIEMLATACTERIAQKINRNMGCIEIMA